MTEYMILAYSAENAADMPEPGTPEFGAYMGEWMAYNQRLIDGGHWVSGASLADTTTATTLARQGGEDTISDGPYAETKEQLGGYYVVKAESLDQAMELAAGLPIEEGYFEVRPVAFRPDA